MNKQEILSIIQTEISFSYSRSSGAGGQNVNKVNSKATMRWNVATSFALTPAAKERFLKLYGHNLTSDMELILSAQESRSQPANKDLCLQKLLAMIEKSYIVPKKRIKTKPNRSSILKRLDHKKKDSEKKRLRKFKYE